MSQHSSITRRMLIGGGAALAIFAASFSANIGPASAQSTLDKAREQGYIRVGFANEAPYGYRHARRQADRRGARGRQGGAGAARHRTGRRRAHRVRLADPGAEAGRFDMVAAGMFITPARCEQVQFSEPSYGIGQAFLVPTAIPSTASPTTRPIAENPDLTLAVMAGAVEAGYAAESGVKDDQLLVLPDQSSLLSAVRRGAPMPPR
jgi:polar amino acid transport system substrate-binding protein